MKVFHCLRRNYPVLAVGFTYVIVFCLLASKQGIFVPISDAIAQFEWATKSDFMRYQLNYQGVLMTPWLPMYPLLIKLINVLTFGIMPPAVLLVGFNFLLWIMLIIATDTLFEDHNIQIRRYGVLFVAMFPFTGLSQITYMSKDILGILMVICALIASRKSSGTGLLISTAIGLLTHKLLWPFFLILSIFGIVKKYYSKLNLLLSGLPLVFYSVAGNVFNPDRSIWWVVLEADGLMRKRYLIVFDSLFGWMFGGDRNDVILGNLNIVFVGLITVAIVSLYHQRKYLFMIPGITIVLFGLMMSIEFAWTLFRFGAIGMVSIIEWLQSNFVLMQILNRKSVFYFMLAILLLSNIIWMIHEYQYNFPSKFFLIKELLYFRLK